MDKASEEENRNKNCWKVPVIELQVENYRLKQPKENEDRSEIEEQQQNEGDGLFPGWTGRERVYVIKKNATGQISRLKAQLVAQCFNKTTITPMHLS